MPTWDFLSYSDVDFELLVISSVFIIIGIANIARVKKIYYVFVELSYECIITSAVLSTDTVYEIFISNGKLKL